MQTIEYEDINKQLSETKKTKPKQNEKANQPQSVLASL